MAVPSGKAVMFRYHDSAPFGNGKASAVQFLIDAYRFSVRDANVFIDYSVPDPDMTSNAYTRKYNRILDKGLIINKYIGKQY